MTRYARYNPALDDGGNPTTGSASTRIVYQLGR
jgi:protein TonB